MPQERFRFLNGREIKVIKLRSKLLSSHLEALLSEIQEWGYNSNFDDPSPNNIEKLLETANFLVDNYRSGYKWVPSIITVKTTLAEPVVIAINQAVTDELQKSSCPDAIMMQP